MRRNLLSRVLLAALPCLGACGEDAHDPRFAGLWLVAQPYHALYEATLYTLNPDGTVAVGRTVTQGSSKSAGYVTGSVAPGPRVGGMPRCVFGPRWRTEDAATLVITGTCTDGKERDIVLGFPADVSMNGRGVGVSIRSVGGESGWIHDDWDWAFVRCKDEPSCLPA